jgi:hypothetical protein
MFNRKNENFYNQGFYQDNQMQRLFYQFEETNRKLRNLNNRLRRLENYLGLRNEDKYDEDLYENA